MEEARASAVAPPDVEPVAPLDEAAVFQALPRKANADLRRDVQRKMDKLEPATQRAMILLLRQEEASRAAAADAAAGAPAGGQG